jgi:NAD(P)-dependent dehydrogenase (short-subunit alcohol dehydrogenase family)
VADFQAAKRIIDCAISNFGQLNILVNNAGPLRDRMIFNMSEEDWDISLNTHLKGCFNCTRHACAYWRVEHKAGRVRGGRIINILSDAGLYGSPGQANYSAAKGGIGGFTMAVAQAMERYEVTCNAVAPGGRTRMVLETPSLAPLAKEPPPGEFDMMDPENVGPIVAFLASDEAKDITGEVFRLIGDRVWLLRGWHTIDTVAKGKAKWTPEELVPVVKGMMKKAPPKTSIMDIFKEAGMI